MSLQSRPPRARIVTVARDARARRGPGGARRGAAGGGAREHDHQPRPAAAGQPRGGARVRGRGARRGRPCRPRSRWSPARCASGSTTTALEAIARPRRRRQVRRARPRAGDRPRRVTARRRSPPPPRSRCAAGIGVFATGGLGGVHRGRARAGTSRPTSPRSRGTPIAVVCAGVKSILDVGATLERLETLNVTVLGYGTDALPRLLPRRLGLPGARGGSTRRRRRRRWCARAAELGTDAAIVVANPLPASEQLDPELHDRVLAEGLEAAARGGRDRQGRDAVPARLLPPRDRRAQPRGQRADRAAQRRAGGADRRGAVSRIVVVGDVMVDVVARAARAAGARQRHAGGDRAPRGRLGGQRRGVAGRGGRRGAFAGRWATTRSAARRVAELGRAWTLARRARPRACPPARASCSCIPGGERTMIPDAGRQRRARGRGAARRRPPARDGLRAAARGLAPGGAARAGARRASAG